MKKTFYITSAIPYVNAKPHVGHALEFVQADILARYHRLLGQDVRLLSGGDENALKNVQAAEKANTPLQTFIDENTQLFADLAFALDVKFDVFQKGSDTKKHFPSSQLLWQLCDKNGDIYKKSYEGLYCIGCETFYSKEELNEQGECFEHPGRKLEFVKEENYFFKLSHYQEQLIQLISSDTLHIVSQSKKNEILAFLKQPLQDISISRSNERAKNWGVPVPNDPTQRMYVWFDALNIYQSGIGFGWDDAMYKKWWPADIHVIGKGISRFHAIYWPAFLLSAKLALPHTLFVHGYFTVNGQKMSKTLGNVIDPIELIQKYTVDPLRYYFLREISPFSDGDFSERRFIELYNADLANGLGNVLSRVAKLGSTVNTPFTPKPWNFSDEAYKSIHMAMDHFLFHQAIIEIWSWITLLDQEINADKPWELTGENLYNKIHHYINDYILKIAIPLEIFLPSTAQKITQHFSQTAIIALPPLFPRVKQ